MKRIYLVGTADTKPDELQFIAARIRSCGAVCVIVDVGTRSSGDAPSGGAPSGDVVDVSAAEVSAYAPGGPNSVLGHNDRGKAVAGMADAFTAYIANRDDIAGIIGIGGGGGTSIITAGMRGLPIGLPKVMVSTLASGDVSPYVGESDIIFVPSITDMTGINRVSSTILHNAATAIAAMAAAPAAGTSNKPAVGLTMFGVTTTAVAAIAEHLKHDYDCLPFHATGTGGRTMENLVASGMLGGVLDITTTEICDLLFGGVMPASQDRLDVIAQTKVPYVGSVGALDMVNFWAMETVPERYAGRLLYRHNPNVTLMRTTAAECREIALWLAGKLDTLEGPVRFLIPEKGVSALDVEGGEFFDPEADTMLFETIAKTVDWTPRRQLIRLPHHINDPEFAAAAARCFREIATDME